MLALALVGVGGSSGCKTSPSALMRVSFRSLDTGKRYSQQFDNAVYARTDSGQVHVVLTDLGQPGTRAAPGRPLEPSIDAPLKQILTLRVLWRPPRAAKPDQLTSSNAAIDWYVVEDSAGAAPQWLHYSGSGFARVDASGGGVGSVEVRNATLTLANRVGEMDDPLGRVDVSGSFSARRDSALVDAVLRDVRERYSRQPPPGSELQGPPPRQPAGP